MWVESTGSPILLISVFDHQNWEGDSIGGESSHYSMACAVNSEIELVDFGGGQAIVFGGEPFRSRFRFRDDNAVVEVWRQVYSEGNLSIESIDDLECDWVHEFDVDLFDVDYLLIDSVFANNDPIEPGGLDFD